MTSLSILSLSVNTCVCVYDQRVICNPITENTITKYIQVYIVAAPSHKTPIGTHCANYNRTRVCIYLCWVLILSGKYTKESAVSSNPHCINVMVVACIQALLIFLFYEWNKYNCYYIITLYCFSHNSIASQHFNNPLLFLLQLCCQATQ